MSIVDPSGHFWVCGASDGVLGHVSVLAITEPSGHVCVFVDGDVVAVGHVSVLAITEPSGHVCVFVDGGVPTGGLGGVMTAGGGLMMFVFVTTTFVATATLTLLTLFTLFTMFVT
jgi:hypothetical protein